MEFFAGQARTTSCLRQRMLFGVKLDIEYYDAVFCQSRSNPHDITSVSGLPLLARSSAADLFGAIPSNARCN